MARPYSADLRIRVVHAYKNKQGSYEELAKLFGIARTTVNRWLRLDREQGNVYPKDHGGGARRQLDAQGEELLRRLVGTHADATLDELCIFYHQHTGCCVGRHAVFDALKRLKITRKKKTLFSTERKSDRVRLMRWHFTRIGLCQRASSLIFFDESGFHLSMTRPYARAPRNQRALDDVPKNWGDNLTLVAGMSIKGMVAPILMKGSMTGSAFADSIHKRVVPTLKPGDIVVLDNLGAHKISAVQHAVESVGASLLFLPPYSPDFNPIELAWAKIKACVRKLAPRTLEPLIDAVACALHSLSLHDIQAWFHHAGYQYQSI